MTAREAAHAFAQFEGSLGRLGSVRAVFMGDGTDFEIPSNRRSTSMLRPLAIARQDTRQQTAIVGWTRAFGDVAVTRLLLPAMVAGAAVPRRAAR